jgi:hypothetical protein
LPENLFAGNCGSDAATTFLPILLPLEDRTKPLVDLIAKEADHGLRSVG